MPRTTHAGRPTVLIPAQRFTPSEPTGGQLHNRRTREIVRDYVIGAGKYFLFWVIAVIVITLIAGCAEPTAPAPVASVVVTADKSTLSSLGETAQLSAVVRDAAGNVLEGRALTWTSATHSVATVSANAVVQAVTNGQATITATAEGITGNVTITVAQQVASVEIAAPTTSLVSFGETVQLTATARDALGNTVANKVATWTSPAANSVSVNATTGVATAVADGQSAIKATIDGVFAEKTITVARMPAKLAFIAPVRTTQNGVVIPSVGVVVQDALGTWVRSATPKITVDIGANPANGGLAGPQQVSASNGTAAFSLAINNAGVGYTLTASAPGMTPATSNAFEIMNVPARIDSVKLVSTNLKVGTSTSYTAYITNGAGRNLTLAGVQGYIQQGTVNNGAGGSQTVGCGPTNGVVPHGSCAVSWAFSLNGGTYVAGAATGKIELREGTTLRGSITLPVVIVP